MIGWDKIISSLDLILFTSPATLNREIRGVYCGDLLSDVLAHASPGDIWITIHRHRNIIAVASLVNLSGIIITRSREPESDTLDTAIKEGLPVFSTPYNNYETAGKLYKILQSYQPSK